jgi:hypothetical protein
MLPPLWEVWHHLAGEVMHLGQHLVHGVDSAVSRRGYRTALRQFLAWHLDQGGGPLSRALVQRYRVVLEGRNLAPSTLNQHLSAIRALADECAESGPLAVAENIRNVPKTGR